MDRLAQAHAAAGVQSAFVYVREAHPGEHFPHHTTFGQKLAHARAFQELFVVERPILVDDLRGTAHAAFGRLPNMTYILNQSHTVVFRADWTDATTVGVALDYLLDAQARRRDGARLGPFVAELQGQRANDPVAFDAALERNGPKAVTEMRAARERWARGEHLGKLR